ncbi:hypothetical protein I2F30_13760 [Acinetobacter sp. SCC474]|uniref:hypothetical protein n=1 Tax=Acinetobacter pollinis TaxID=2605270 RepID=UPI0018A2C94F|nr:hypothetical protein [Acinetobacter pollinis]MBF7691781.1 hypothetical protein [Acinetobacter pollinis]
MNLEHKYSEYVVGLVVTDKNTGRTLNFFYEAGITNNPEPHHFLTYDCKEDEIYEKFSEKELKEMSSYVSNLPNVETLEDEFSAIINNGLSDKVLKIGAEQGCLYYQDIIDLYRTINDN